MKYFFALNSQIFQLRMAQKQEEGEEQEHSNYKALCVINTTDETAFATLEPIRKHLFT